MKKSFMTRVLATGLSVAMAFSLSTATNLVSAQAASKPVLVDYATGGSGKTMTVNVDETAKIKVNAATKKNYKIASVKKSSAKIKAAVNKAGTVVTVRGVTATEENKPAAIKVSFTAKKTGKTSKYTFASKVTVVAPKPAVAELTAVTQKEAAKFAATLSVAVDSVDAKDFTIVRTSDNAVIPVKSVSLDDAKTGVTIETFMGLTDAKEYTFTYTAKDEAKTTSSATLTVTDNKIAKLALTTANVTAGTADDGVKVQTLDANGVLLSTLKFSECSAKYIDVTVTPVTAGYRDGDKIFLPEIGNTATVKVVYHTYKYVDGKEEGAIEETFTVTAVADATVMSNFNYTIGTTTPAWDSASFKANHTVSISDTTSKAFFLFKNSKNEKKTAGYKVSSSDSSVLMIANTSLIDEKTGVAIAGVKAGTAYIVVKDAKDNLVQTLPVEVLAKRVATSLDVSAQSVTISRSASASAIKTVDLYVKDQYGEKMNINTIGVENLSRPSGCSTAAIAEGYLKTPTAPAINENKGVVTIFGPSFEFKGTYTYKYSVKVGDKTVNNTLTVNVTEPSEADTVSYDIELTDSIDMLVNKTNKSKNQTIKVGKYKGGILYDYVEVQSIASIEVKHTDGSTLKVNSTGATAKEMTAEIVTENVGSGASVKAAKVGTYTVKVVLQGDKTLTKVFTVTDTQLPVSFSVKKTATGSNTDIKAILSNTDYVSYSYDNSDVIKGIVINQVHGKDLANQNVIYVTSVDVIITLPNDGTKLLVNVPVNQQFTADTTWTTGQVVD